MLLNCSDDYMPGNPGIIGELQTAEGNVREIVMSGEVA